jgi:hypothetical protein
LVLKSDPISERYQIEVDYATNRLVRAYARALKARDRAQTKLLAAVAHNAKESQLCELRRVLEIREYELKEIEKLMQPGNRAKVPWRPVPITNP